MSEGPSYYDMGEETDIFYWLLSLPLPPAVPPSCIISVVATWMTGFRYARRCLWKGRTTATLADDAEKAADTFKRLAEILRSI